MKNRWTLCLLLSCLAFVSLVPLQVRGEELEIRIIVPKAEVYLKPSANSLIVATVPMGVNLKVTQKQDEWYRVNLPPDKNGFILAGFVSANAVEIVSTDFGQKDAVVEPPKKDKPAEKILMASPPRVPREKKKSAIGFSIKLWGGGGYLFENQYNDHLRSQNAALAASSSVVVNREFTFMNTASNLGAEFILHIGSNLGVGFGIGYYMAKKESRAELSGVIEPGDITWTLSPKITALPMTLSILYRLPFGDKFRLNLVAGAGFYNGKAYWKESYEYTSPIFGTGYMRQDWYAYNDALGFHGGLELEWEIVPGIGLVIGAFGQNVALTDLTGDLTWSNVASFYGIDESGEEKDITLWFLEEDYYGPWYPQLWLREDEPSSPFVRNVEKARISMSNISLLVGIKIYLKKI